MEYTSPNQWPNLAKQINNFLIKDFINPKREPIFRLVWGPDCLEKRYGEFNIHTKEGIFLKTVKGIHEVKKYWYLPPTWIIEKWYPPYPDPELEDGGVNGFYIPIFVYAKGSEVLPLNPLVAEIVKYKAISPALSPALLKSISDLHEKEKEEEIDKYFDDLADEITIGDDIAGRLHNKSGVSLH
jgi:hypothetical protein